jgi:hypothetical protein
LLEGGARQIVGTEVAGWLYFTETGEYQSVEVNVDKLGEIIKVVTSKIKTVNLGVSFIEDSKK